MNDELTNKLTKDVAAHKLARREFCNTLARGAATLVVCVESARAGQTELEPHRLLHYPPQRIIGAESLLPGNALAFNYPTAHDPALLVRAPTGALYAYGQRCTHRSCSVNFDRRTNRFECPCHRGAFDLTTGNVLQGPPRRPLNQIELELRAGGEVWAVGRCVS
jgi:nitrite reductase/ring-hydroxylating ferredoxin subunit